MLRKVFFIAYNNKQSLSAGQGNIQTVRGLCESQRILLGVPIFPESRIVGRIIFVGLNNVASHHRDNDYVTLHTLESVNGTDPDWDVFVKLCQRPYLLYLLPIEADNSDLLIFLFIKFVKVPGDANLSSNLPITSTSP